MTWHSVWKWQSLIWPLFFLVVCTVSEPPKEVSTTSIEDIATLPVRSTVRPSATITLELSPSFTPAIFTDIEITPTETSTATPVSSPTPTPTPTLTWTPDPPEVLRQLPPITHDLLVIADGSLKLWNHETGQIEILLEAAAGDATADEQNRLGEITHFQIDADGQSLVAARLTADNPPTHTLIWLNLDSRETQELVTDIPYLLDFEIAPDSRRVAYTVGDPLSIDLDNSGPEPLRGTIYVQDVEPDQPPQQIGSCSNVTASGEEEDFGCLGLIWSLDGQKVIWADAQGVWEHSWSTSEIHLLQSNLYDGYEINIYIPKSLLEN